ncbi:hypothetical protein ABLW17_01325 [Anaerococcus murdochii]|uniref:Uncharacterized protein n=1 Tax=Anaerococcus murdochii TaxID=411577 RepID=A0ABS7T050_9FIRM|nr:hypothetical protein [Anaerococcus murdochii]MBZ2387164.1 hypothetical protein [Anaerococcus murdochii]
MLRLLIYFLFVLGNIFFIPSTYRKYKESRDKLDLAELIGLILMLPLPIVMILDRFIH